LRIHDVAALDHGQRVAERETCDLRDDLVVIASGLVLRQVTGEKEMDALVREPGRGEDRSQAGERRRVQPRLLAPLSRGARLGRLARPVEHPGRKLPDEAAGGVPELT